ncbi:late cornified envelope protein 3D-like isoform X1 [Pteropus medius]|uniref:late cornified envelope protein 3D-like isoform X1 n=1 Tax=Pteropus vampyrus TaxID=132908 RepID=UPI00196B680D|nr:late cornified envelope protein 3D-like isoform X1 [Pteropus giganteus]
MLGPCVTSPARDKRPPALGSTSTACSAQPPPASSAPVQGQVPAEMSCQQNQQQCQPPPKCVTPKCPPKSPAQCLPAAPSACAPSSEGGCCLGHHRHRRSHRCRRQSSDSCDTGYGPQSGGSGCGQGSGGCC